MKQVMAYYKNILGCLILIFMMAHPGFSQKNKKQSGHYFQSNAKTQFNRTIRTWRYFYQRLNADTSKFDCPVPIGFILFWRSSAIPSYNGGKEIWPYIGFDIFEAKDSAALRLQSEATIMNSPCKGPTIGGDIFWAGNFILFNPNSCVPCSNETSIDFCRNSIRQILEMATIKDKTNLQTIIASMPVAFEKPDGFDFFK